MDRITRALLVAGVVGAALLLLVIIIDGAVRPGYSVWHHGVSQLTLGEYGWLERATYVVSGILLVAFGVGVKRALGTGRAATWGPRLVVLTGLGLVAAGVFPTDPALGYPVGVPASVTASGRLHQVAGTFLFIGLIGSIFVVARRLSRTWSLTVGTVVTVSALIAGIGYRLETLGVLSGAPVGALERVAFAAGFGWLAWFAVHLMRGGGRSDGR